MSTEDEALAELKAAMRGQWRIERVFTFRGIAVQVYAKAPGARAYKKAGPVLFPYEGGTVADTLTMLGSMATEAPERGAR